MRKLGFEKLYLEKILGIKKETIKQHKLQPIKTGKYHEGICGADLSSPVQFPDVLGINGRKLHEFGVRDRKECVKKNLGVELTPSQLFAVAGLTKKGKK